MYSALRSTSVKSHFSYAIKKYGKRAFSHEVLQVVDSLEAANTAEIYWISHFDTRNPDRGFNIAPGGGVHNPNKFHNPWLNPEYRDKITLKSKSRPTPLKLKNPSAETRLKLSKSTKDSWTQEKRQKQSEYMRRNGISDALLHAARHPSESTRLKISKSQKDRIRIYTPELRAKLSAASKKAVLTPDRLEKIRNPSPETILKIKASLHKHYARKKERRDSRQKNKSQIRDICKSVPNRIGLHASYHIKFLSKKEVDTYILSLDEAERVKICEVHGSLSKRDVYIGKRKKKDCYKIEYTCTQCFLANRQFRYKSENKDKITARNKEFRARNPEKYKASLDKWREENREELLEKKRRHYLENKEKINSEKRAKRRIVSASLQTSLTAASVIF